MKNILLITFAQVLTLVAFCQGEAKAPKTITTQFSVASVCGQCEETIERAMDVKGVVAADYNLETKILVVTFKTNKISETKLHELINEVGYDTELSTATDEQYSKVHHCCKYRELDDH
ncbi:MAG: heavy-metal-associated domain-containing protein [Flavobacteriales bacterium]|nr:heavy-metal-associated domain-containing protein [Flavobacteriales bacterium]